MKPRFKFQSLVARVCIFALLSPIVESAAFASITDGYTGNTISGRPSVAIVNAPGGTKVNTFLGNMFLPRTDFRIPGRGLPIEIKFTYNSNEDVTNSPFGFGWQFNYAMSSLSLVSGNVVIFWGDGRMDQFRQNGSTFTPLNEGVFVTLAQPSPNVFQLTTEHQIQFFFQRPSPSAPAPLQKIQDPNGNSLTFTYNVTQQLTTITDASGREVNLSYNVKGKLVTITDPNTLPPRTFQYGYDANGNQASVTDPLGNVTTYSYDAGHRLIKVSDPLGITTISYGVPHMAVASISRSDLGNILLSKRSFFYDTATTTTSVTDMLDSNTSATTKYRYDQNRRLVNTIDPLGNIETRTYDAKGNIASIKDANGNITTYTYDSKGNVLTTTDGRGDVTSFTYDSIFNKLTAVTDPNGHTALYSYDAHGNALAYRDPLGNITRYSYDEFGELVSRQNARGYITAFAYDSYGDQTDTTDPLSRTRSLAYDHVGNALSRTDANHQTTTYSYDARDRLTRTVFPDSTQETFTYNSEDDLLTAIDPNANQTFTHDAAGRIVQIRDNLKSKTITFQYDGVGHRTQMIDPEGTIVTYAYDLAGRPTTVAANDQQFTFTFDSGNRLTQVAYPNGSFTTYKYDAADRVLSVVNERSDNSVISSFSYQYDKAGNRTRLTLVGGDATDYTYDKFNQLIEEVRSGSTVYTHQFKYDAVGNRIQLNANGVITTSSYDKADQLTKEATGMNNVSYKYDGNGNRVQKIAGGGSSTYSYDFDDRLIGFASSTSSASYALDWLGRRVSKTLDGTTTQFVYDGPDTIAEYDGSGTLLAQTLYALYGPDIDQNLLKVIGGMSLYYIPDGLNSVRNIVDSSQKILNSYDYDAWGTVLSKVEKVTNDYMFTGKRMDHESGLYYYRSRMYDPSNVRFLQVDPEDRNDGASAYVYVENSPTNFVDPAGEDFIIPFLVGAAVAYAIYRYSGGVEVHAKIDIVIKPVEAPPAAPPKKTPPRKTIPPYKYHEDKNYKPKKKRASLDAESAYYAYGGEENGSPAFGCPGIDSAVYAQGT